MAERKGLNRIAYFTPTKRDGMFVGVVNDENLDSLIETIKEARGVGKGIIFFLWSNEPKEGRKSVATLTVAVQQDREQTATPNRRPIGSSPPDSRPAPANDPLAGLLGGNKPAKSNRGGF